MAGIAERRGRSGTGEGRLPPLSARRAGPYAGWELLPGVTDWLYFERLYKEYGLRPEAVSYRRALELTQALDGSGAWDGQTISRVLAYARQTGDLTQDDDL